MKNNKKKIAVLSIMTVLLVVSAVLNVWLNTKLTKRQETLTTNTHEPTVTETFKSFRSSRETTRQELIDYLDAIISSESASASAKTAAETQKQSVCKQMGKRTSLRKTYSGARISRRNRDSFRQELHGGRRRRQSGSAGSRANSQHCDQRNELHRKRRHRLSILIKCVGERV